MLVVVTLAGCGGGGQGASRDASRAAPDTYVVKAGDTLFGIASRFALDYHDVARWNRLGDGSRIYPGQRLRLTPPQGLSGAPPPRGDQDGEPALAPAVTAWQWPTDGLVVAGFGQSQNTASGVLIGGRPGQAIVAAADGDIVYAGSGLAGYGQLVIIKHNAAWLSAYGHNEQLLVREGDRVRAGQPIARMGAGAGREAVLHFEIRRNGEAVNPLPFFPGQP